MYQNSASDQILDLRPSVTIYVAADAAVLRPPWRAGLSNVNQLQGLALTAVCPGWRTFPRRGVMALGRDFWSALAEIVRRTPR